MLTCPIATRLRQELASLPAYNSPHFHSRANQIRAKDTGLRTAHARENGVDRRNGSLCENLPACYIALKSYLQNEALKPKLCQPFTYQTRCTRGENAVARAPWTSSSAKPFLSADSKYFQLNVCARVLQLEFSPSSLSPTPQLSPLASMEDCIDVRFLRFSQQQPSSSWTSLNHDRGHRGHPWANVTWTCLSSVHLLQL